MNLHFSTSCSILDIRGTSCNILDTHAVVPLKTCELLTVMMQFVLLARSLGWMTF